MKKPTNNFVIFGGFFRHFYKNNNSNYISPHLDLGTSSFATGSSIGQFAI